MTRPGVLVPSPTSTTPGPQAPTLVTRESDCEDPGRVLLEAPSESSGCAQDDTRKVQN